MSEAPPSVPRFGSDFGPVRGEKGLSERFPASPRFPLGSPGVVSRISEARFSVQTWTVLHPRRTESIREARRSERFPVYSKGPPSITEGRRAPVSKIGPSQTPGIGYFGRRAPDEESVPPAGQVAGRRPNSGAPDERPFSPVGSAGVWHRCRGDLEDESEVHLRVQAVHAPEGLRVDPAGDHLGSKIDPAAGEVHDEGGLSRFFHDRRPNRGPSKAGWSKPFDNTLGASARGVLRRCASPDPDAPTRPSGSTEGRHASHPDREAVNL